MVHFTLYVLCNICMNHIDCKLKMSILALSYCLSNRGQHCGTCITVEDIGYTCSCTKQYGGLSCDRGMYSVMH